jgi:hypothetical protein
MQSRRWTQAEDEWLSKNARSVTEDEAKAHLSRSSQSVFQRAVKLGVRFKDTRRKWSDQEDNKIIYLAETMSSTQIAKELGRTQSSIKIRAFKLGITLSSGRRSLREAADLLGINYHTAWKLRNKLHLDCRRYTDRKQSKTMAGVSDEHLVKMAKSLLTNNHNNLRTSVKRLRDVIHEHSCA